MDAIEKTPVLIVGGGLTGLVTALFLQRHGTPFVLIEREQAASPLPRARGWAVRSMELFRQLGLQQAIEEAADRAWEQGVFGGARRGATMLSSEELEIPDTGVLTGEDPSPCRMVACPQTEVEPILRRALEERGGDVRFGHELTGFDMVDDGIRATVRSADGEETVIQASYMVAADGSRGSIRHKLGIERSGSGHARHYVNIFFEADLADRMRDRTFSQCEIENDTVSGVFLSMNNTTKWSFHLLFDPEKDDPRNWSDDRLTELLHAAIGEDIDLTVRHHGTWTAVDRIADRYSEGRIFLVGDSAHIMPPWGGLNGNTGIADANDLAWRLAGAVADRADAGLLDAYDGERRPVAVRNGGQARLRSDYELRFGIRTPANAADFDKLRDGGELLMRYRYGKDDTVEALHGQPGTRFPHAWIEQDGERRSTLDLFGDGFVTLAGPDGAADTVRAGVDFQFSNPDIDWAGLVRDGRVAVRVRPDGFVSDLNAPG